MDLLKLLRKQADVYTPLQEHQQRVIEKLQKGNVLVAHGMGSGKTLQGVTAADVLGMPAEVFVPAPLVENFKKEIEKHTKGTLRNKAVVRSISKAVLDRPEVDPGSLMVVDEAHMARNAGSGRSQYLMSQAPKAGRVMLLTGTPSYNDVSDIASLINIIHQRNVLPTNKTDFYKKFVEERQVKPGWWGRLWGVKPGVERTLTNKEQLEDLLRGHVDVYAQSEGMPSKTEQDVEVQMTPEQEEMYRFVEGSMPWWLQYKLRHNLPPSKSESRNLNAFLTGVRQVSNTPGVFMRGTTPLQRGLMSSKLLRAVTEIKRRKQNDPNFRGFVYSNFKDSGVEPMKALLDKLGIGSGIIHGGLSMPQKKQLVEAYNKGELPVLLGTSAATEGFDLKGTKLVQILEPHFNNSKINQAIGRGIRYKSHEHLPTSERNVVVQRFYSKPREGVLDFLTGGDTGADRWVKNRANEKEQLIAQLRGIMERLT